MVDSGLGKIPKGFRVANLPDLVDFERGIEPGSRNYLEHPEPGTVPFLRVGDLGSKRSPVYIPKELAKGKLLESSDIAITLDGTVGRVRIGLQGAYSSGIRKVSIQDTEHLSWSFLHHLLLSEHIQNVISAHARGTTILHAGSAINHMTFVLPTKELVKAFDHIAGPLLTYILNLTQTIETLRNTRDVLLPRLISGDLEVSNLDISTEVLDT